MGCSPWRGTPLEFGSFGIASRSRRHYNAAHTHNGFHATLSLRDGGNRSLTESAVGDFAARELVQHWIITYLKKGISYA